MTKRFYPAVLERDPSGVFGLWFPDFPGAVAGGHTQEEAVARGQAALERAMQAVAERELPLPAPTAFEAIRPPKGADVVTILALAATPPDPSERVNIYLPKSVIERADDLAASWGVSRSSLFGLALTRLMATSPWAGMPPEAIQTKKKGRAR
ncbi:MAG TPA: type II toxin-antitoxin system HicB family antitoxin [Caulobacteraceae bacterium]|jgi:predicted RNase H-like HicB family nuclease